MKTTLVNLHTYKDTDVVYIDRRNRLLGNPHRIGTWSRRLGRKLTRADAVAMFKIDFWCRINEDPVFRTAVEALRGKRLACWCTPLPCHGDIYIEYLEKTNVSTR